jgi:Flp pilus assembly protein TadB
MNIRQMAIMNVAKLIAGALAIGIAVNVGIHYLGLALVGVIFAAGLFAYMIKFAYDIELSKLESKNALTKLKDME